MSQVDVREFPAAAVLGDGKLAQLIARVLQAAGACVVLFGKHENKLALARSAGIATRHVHSRAARPKPPHETYPLVIEATGSPTGLALATQITEPRGTLVLKSTFHGEAPVETWPIVVKEINVLGSRCGPFDKALALLRTKAIDPRPLISRIFPLAEARAAIKFAQQPGVMKVLLKP